MSKTEKIMWVAVYLAIGFLGWVVLHGCGASTSRVFDQGEQATRCEAKAVELVFASDTCTEAQIRVYALMRSDPDCRAIYPDGGPDVCAKYNAQRDGGNDGPHGDR